MLYDVRIFATDFPSEPGIWFGILLSVYFFSDSINAGFGRKWGWKPSLTVVGLMILAAVVNFIVSGSFWGLSLGILFWGIVTWATGLFGISFIIAAIIKTPGCEAGAIRQLMGRDVGDTCSLGIHRLDSWEAKRKKKTA